VVNVYIDSDVIVSAEISSERNHEQSKKFMDLVLNIKVPEISYVTSVFTFLELASAMIRRTKNQDRTYSLLYRIQKPWRESIKPYPPLEPAKNTSYTRLVNSLAETAIRFRTRSGDTIHAQTIALYKCDYLVTWNVRHFSLMTKKIRSLKIIRPPEMMSELKGRLATSEKSRPGRTSNKKSQSTGRFEDRVWETRVKYDQSRMLRMKGGNR